MAALSLSGLLTTGCFTQPGNSADGLYADVARSSESTECKVPADAQRMVEEVLQLVNLERASSGLSPVVIEDRLTKAADDYACRMIESSFFGHADETNGDGPGERALAAGYSYFAVGENLAAGQADAREVMADWMTSPAHRSIILDPRWKQVGISVRSGGQHAIYWVQEFGDPAGM